MTESTQARQTHLPTFEPPQAPKLSNASPSSEQIRRDESIEEEIRSKLTELRGRGIEGKKIEKRYLEWRVEAEELIAKRGKRFVPAERKLEMLEGAKDDKKPKWLLELEESMISRREEKKPPEEEPLKWWDKP